jgi:hypothetical protein
MVDAATRMSEIEREACRRVMEERFSDTAVVDAYQALYYRILNRI